MKKDVLILIIMAIAAMNFRGTEKLAPSLAAGTYGGGCQVQLKINTDHTFSYCDRSVQPHLYINGEWEQTDGVIKLKGPAGVKFHNRWKIDGEYPCLKSRKGLNWRRLCLSEKQ